MLPLPPSLPPGQSERRAIYTQCLNRHSSNCSPTRDFNKDSLVIYSSLSRSHHSPRSILSKQLLPSPAQASNFFTIVPFLSPFSLPLPPQDLHFNTAQHPNQYLIKPIIYFLYTSANIPQPTSLLPNPSKPVRMEGLVPFHSTCSRSGWSTYPYLPHEPKLTSAKRLRDP